MTTWDESARRKLSKERGTVIKDWGGRVPVALVYPNSYYVGMSSLGFQTLYALLNQYDNVVCERAFWDGKTAERLSLESQRPLTDFAIVAFSISYELDYFNVVDMLRSSGIPLYATQRDDSHPLVIAGGPCVTANPQPVAPIIDCVAIGEAEAIVPALMDVVNESVEGRRDDLLEALSHVPGLYVPSVRNGGSIRRQWVRDLDAFPATSLVVTPDTELGRLYLIEVTRGCRWGCRFCLAGFHFRPFRYRSVAELLRQAEIGLTHEKRIGLLGASPSDHPHIEELVAELRRLGAQISISSLRIRPLPGVLPGELSRGGAQTIALAPEAGSDRLRRIINKGVAEPDIIEAMDRVSRERFKHVKLYFMIGLPGETDDDVEDIVELVLALKAASDRRRAGTRIAVAVEPFVPKAGTPFQWVPMASADDLRYRLARLRHALRPKGIDVASESVNWMVVQGVLARGDARLADVLATMEGRTLQHWRRALAECSLSAEHYVNRHIPYDEKLPWANIDSGVTTDYLQSELRQACLGGETPPCPLGECHACGVC